MRALCVYFTPPFTIPPSFITRPQPPQRTRPLWSGTLHRERNHDVHERQRSFRVHALLQRSRPQGFLGDPRRPAQRHAATHTHTRPQHGERMGCALQVWLQGQEPAQPTQPPDPPLQWCRIRLVELHTRPDLFGEPLLFDLTGSGLQRYIFSKAFSRNQIRAEGFPAFRREGPGHRAA